MNQIDQETLAEIKKIDLLTYLSLYDPSELVHVSRDTYSTKSHDSVIISNGLWNRFSSGDGGRSALDYLMKVEHMDFLEAARHILEKRQLPSKHISPVSVPVKKSERELLLPAKADTNEHAISYLICRGINREIIQDFVSDGLLYETVFQGSKSTHRNVVFLGKDHSGATKYALIRGIHTAFKGEAAGSDKRFPPKSLSTVKDTDALHLFESAIDLLSCATHIKMTGKDYKTYNLLSLAGVYRPAKEMEKTKMPAPLKEYLDHAAHTQKIILHLDNDAVGRMATTALKTIVSKDYDAEVIDCPPPCGKDYNEYLRSLLQQCSDKSITYRKHHIR